MYFLSIPILLITFSLSESKDVAGYQAVSDESAGHEDGNSRPMLRKAVRPAKVTTRESYSADHDGSDDAEETNWLNQDHRELAKDCGGNQEYFKIDVQTDEFGFENSWKLKKRQNNKWVQIKSGPPNGSEYAGNNRFTGGYCLSPGNYRFIMLDLFKDGMCCEFGNNGKYSGYVNGSKKFSSPPNGEDWAKRVHNFSVSNSPALPFDPKIAMTKRETEWLESHNTRRRSWHTRHGKAFVPLEWSIALKTESKKFAQKLLRDSCGDLYHDPDNIHGENLASNYGSGQWAGMRSVDSIVTRWVEDEADDGYPANGHLTQVLWRASKYVGCADASKPRNGGGTCHVQVCRYARPGNCNMSKYKSNQKDWWKKPMLMADSVCGPACPPDGC